MIFSSQIKILRLGAIAGFAVVGISILAAVYFICLKLLYPEQIQVHGWTSLFLAVTFFGGLSIFMLGISLQYLSSLVLKAHGKPTYFTIDRSGDAATCEWFAARHEGAQSMARSIAAA
jgi:hypothetical protein